MSVPPYDRDTPVKSRCSSCLAGVHHGPQHGGVCECECHREPYDRDTPTEASVHGVAPCFMPCGQPACERLGCIRVYNAEHRTDAECTGLTAIWCPVHGDCTCPDRENAMDSNDCPLHAPKSTHPRRFGGREGRHAD